MNASIHANAVAVVIPAYNASRFVADAIGSAIAQGPVVTEIIVVDDGSKDDTVSVVKGISDSRIRLITQANAGPAAARNRGWRAATARWIMFVDSDDAIAPNALNALLNAVPSGAASVIPYGREELHGLEFADKPVHMADLAQHGGSLLADIAVNYQGTIFCGLLPRACLEAVNGLDEKVVYGEDFDLALRLAQRYEFIWVDVPVYRARMHEENRHRHFPAEARQAYVATVERVFADGNAPGTIRRRALAHWHWVFGKSLQAAGKKSEARAAFRQSFCAWPFKLDAWRQFLLG